MLNAVIDWSLHNRFIVLGAALGFVVLGLLALPQSADRRLSRHDAGAGADQHLRAGLGAGRRRTADHGSCRAGDQRPAALDEHAFDLEVRPVAGGRHVRGRHRHLLRPATGRRTAGDGRHSRRRAASRAWGRWRPAWARCFSTSSPARNATSARSANCRTGSSARRCAACRVRRRSTAGAAKSNNSRSASIRCCA